MTTRQRRTRRRGLTGDKVYELLTGLIRYPATGYGGYGHSSGPKITREFQDSESLRAFEAAVHPRHSATATYSSVEPFISDEMRADWRAHRDGLLRFWISGGHSTSERLQAAGVEVKMGLAQFFRGEPGTRPWAWWQFDAPEPLPEGEDEVDYLARHALLFPGERVG